LAVLIDTSAFSQKTSPPPYTVDSEVTLYGDGATWGCADLGGMDFLGRCWSYTRPAHVLITSYNQAGTEVLLSWSAPDAQMDAMYMKAIVKVADLIEKFKLRFCVDPDPEVYAHAVLYWGIDNRFVVGESAPLVSSGCKPPGRTGEVIGQDVLLGYATVVG